MNQSKTVVREKSAERARVVINGNGSRRVVGIPLLPGYGPSELRDAKVGIPASRLAEYLVHEGGPALGLSLVESLKRVLATLDAYRFNGKLPGRATLVTLDAAEQNVKWFLFTKYKNQRVRLGQSSKDHDYLANETLMKAADALSYYLEPDGDRVIVRFFQSLSFEPQIKLEGYAIRQMPEEVKGAIIALLGLVGAELVSNGNSYTISVPD